MANRSVVRMAGHRRVSTILAQDLVPPHVGQTSMAHVISLAVSVVVLASLLIPHVFSAVTVAL